MDTKQKILNSIKKAQESKFTLVFGNWGSPYDKCACPLGCVLLENNDTTDNWYSDDYNSTKVASLLGESEDWVESFVEGFDGYGEASFAKVPAAWKLGKEIREETKPIEFKELEK